MAVMIHSKYGYEPLEWVQADARLDKWLKQKKRLAQQDAFKIHKNINGSRVDRCVVFDHRESFCKSHQGNVDR